MNVIPVYVDKFEAFNCHNGFRPFFNADIDKLKFYFAFDNFRFVNGKVYKYKNNFNRYIVTFVLAGKTKGFIAYPKYIEQLKIDKIKEEVI